MFFAIQYDDIPADRRKEITYSSVVCEVKSHKEDPNRTRITIGGNRICFPGNVGTPTGSLELVKLLINSILSRRGAKFVIFDIKDFYLNTPLERYKYVRVKLTDIPDEFIVEYNLQQFAIDGWVYFKIRKRCLWPPPSW